MVGKINVNDDTIPVPDTTRCWEIAVLYQCGCSTGHVKKHKGNNHTLPCWTKGCEVKKLGYKLPQKCFDCDIPVEVQASIPPQGDGRWGTDKF